MRNPCIIIAEAGVNHNGDVDKAIQMVKAAAGAGADYVKFQTFKADTLVSRKAPKAEYQKSVTEASESQYDMLAALELSAEAHFRIKKACEENDIGFLSSPFDVDSLEFLRGLDLDYIKIPSGEITNRLLLEALEPADRVILSTGMSNTAEVHAALDIILAQGVERQNVTILQCNTEYPTPYVDVNLAAMVEMKSTFKVEVGLSDHTLGTAVALGAVALGAVVIEKHFTLNPNAKGPDHAASLDIDGLSSLVLSAHQLCQAIGSPVKQASASEKKNLAIARKSIHTSRDLKAGHRLTKDDIVMLRPATGISPMEYPSILGKTLTKDVAEHSIIEFSDLS